jgi:hypothetical protein
MKTRLMMLFIMIATSLSYANTVVSVQSKKLTFNTREWKTTSLELSINDTEGNTIHAESFVNTGKTRTYNLKNLVAGTYSFTISDAQKASTQYFVVTPEAITLTAQATTTYFPAIVAGGQYVDVNMVTENLPVVMTIVDADNHIIAKEEVNAAVVNKRFNIEALAAGTYVINVTHKGNTTSKTFQK